MNNNDSIDKGMQEELQGQQQVRGQATTQSIEKLYEGTKESHTMVTTTLTTIMTDTSSLPASVDEQLKIAETTAEDEAPVTPAPTVAVSAFLTGATASPIAANASPAPGSANSPSPSLATTPISAASPDPTEQTSGKSTPAPASTPAPSRRPLTRSQTGTVTKRRTFVDESASATTATTKKRTASTANGTTKPTGGASAAVGSYKRQKTVTSASASGADSPGAGGELRHNSSAPSSPVPFPPTTTASSTRASSVSSGAPPTHASAPNSLPNPPTTGGSTSMPPLHSQLQELPHLAQQLTFYHTSTPTSTTAADITQGARIITTNINNNGLRLPRSRASLPTPIPNLTKKSRGRRVPTVTSVSQNQTQQKHDSSSVNDTAANGNAAHETGANASDGTGADPEKKDQQNNRLYVCTVDGCGKCFHRGEHLKRHIRSIHTHEKPFKCTFPLCQKYFNRHDNLLQHLKVHRDPESTKEKTSHQKPAPETRSRYASTSTASPPAAERDENSRSRQRVKTSKNIREGREYTRRSARQHTTTRERSYTPDDIEDDVDMDDEDIDDDDQQRTSRVRPRIAQNSTPRTIYNAYPRQPSSNPNTLPPLSGSSYLTYQLPLTGGFGNGFSATGMGLNGTTMTMTSASFAPHTSSIHLLASMAVSSLRTELAAEVSAAAAAAGGATGAHPQGGDSRGRSSLY